MKYGIENEVRIGDCKLRKPTKHAENQYTLIETDDGRFFTKFVDGEGNTVQTEITKEIYQELLRAAREDEAYLRWNRRHLDDSKEVEDLPDSFGKSHLRGLEDFAIAKVLLDEESEALSILTESQRRRLAMRYCQELTLYEIADIEGCTVMPIKRCINDAIEKIKIFLK